MKEDKMIYLKKGKSTKRVLTSKSAPYLKDGWKKVSMEEARKAKKPAAKKPADKK